MYWDEINKHMSNKFKNKESIEVLKRLPNQDVLKDMADNKIYKVKFVSIAVDVINFKKMSKYTDPAVFSTVMSEFTYGVSKILKKFGARFIDVQGDAIFGTFSSGKKTEVDNAFYCLCALSSFRKHINKLIERHFPNELKETSIGWSGVDFKFGIGAFFGWKNYISKMGQGSDREVVYMGESVNWSSHLSDKAGRNNNKPILVNEAFKDNMTNDQINKIDAEGGFARIYDYELQEYIYGCDWINSSYDNFIENNI